MEALQAKDIADRDQLWACLRVLRDEVELLAGGTEPLESRQQKLAVLLARIVLAELDYRIHEGTVE
jgi:hypothetical protein